MFCEELFPSFVHWPWWSQYTHPPLPLKRHLHNNIHHTIAIWYIYTNVLWCLIILRVQSMSKQWLATSGLGGGLTESLPFEDGTTSEQNSKGSHACYNNGRHPKKRPNCTIFEKKPHLIHQKKIVGQNAARKTSLCTPILVGHNQINLQPSSESISTFRLWTFCVPGMPCIWLSASWYCDGVH